MRGGGLVLGLLALAGQAAGESLVGELKAEHAASGVILSGMIKNLPANTRIDLAVTQRDGRPLKPPPEASVHLSPDGAFKSEPFAALPAGRYTVTLTSIFNSGWQSVEVLQKAGVDLDDRGRSSIQTNPTTLPKTADFKPFDREFPQASRFLEVTRQVVVPAAPPTEVAVNAVKSAHLTTPEHGRSELSIEQVTRLFALGGGFELIAWSSASGDGGRWIVTLDCRDGGARKEAKWEYDPKTKRVRYLNPLAKNLSWGLRQYGAPGDLGYPR